MITRAHILWGKLSSQQQEPRKQFKDDAVAGRVDSGNLIGQSHAKRVKNLMGANIKTRREMVLSLLSPLERRTFKRYTERALSGGLASMRVRTMPGSRAC